MRNRRDAGTCSFLLAILLLAAIGLDGCSSPRLGDDGESLKRIVLVAPVHAEEQGDAMEHGADAAAKEFGAELDYISFGPDEDAKEQLEAALQAVEGGASAVLIDPANETVLKELAERGLAAGVPVVALNEERSAAGVMAAISIDNEEAGRQAGEALAELLDGSGTVAVLHSDRRDPDLESREAGAKAALAEYAGIQVIDGGACGNLRDACWQAAKVLLDSERVNGILALESKASLGTADEAMRRGVQGKLKIVTFGSELDQLELLQDGILHKLVVQNGFSTGYLGVKQAVELLKGAGFEQPTVLETKVIDADNMFWMDNQKMLFPFVK
ncbi:substrate-binding domain-containing protein [Paenibacillus sp. N4]|uniref:substrate-binding domain-containing protein n=1 Tax=Paenibacillus vietnamensis TaxID=2590547 RepID=UPI001CD153F1|nr:substrate-binding domain-containing protein [Paenibacillus vietnamensis]MCA0756584.1 substrate-binding domain-containing protein [Paenibacillus vietnamensis]